jgi:hypothetical protein
LADFSVNRIAFPPEVPLYILAITCVKMLLFGQQSYVGTPLYDVEWTRQTWLIQSAMCLMIMTMVIAVWYLLKSVNWAKETYYDGQSVFQKIEEKVGKMLGL